MLGKITDKNLLQLLKSGEDFNIKTIKELIDTSICKNS